MRSNLKGIADITCGMNSNPAKISANTSAVASVDDVGNDYAGSTLRFLTQHDLGDRVEASGFFEWRLGQESLGREQVVATYDPSTRQLFIEGKYTDNPDVLAPGSFSAELSEDGRQLVNGRWGNVPGERVGILGTWEARR